MNLQRVREAVSTYAWGALAVVAAGCASPNLTVLPSYQPADAGLGDAGGRTIRLEVADRRQNKGASSPKGREILARGSKGSVFLEEPYADVLRQGLEEAFTEAGYRLSRDAPVLVEAELRRLTLEAKEFTDWGIDSETGSTLDALRIFIPKKTRETTTELDLLVRVRKAGWDAGFSHLIQKKTEKREGDRSIVEAILSQTLSGAVHEAVTKTFSDIPRTAALPVSDAEFREREAAIVRQQAEIDALRTRLQKRQRTITEDRREIDRLRAVAGEEQRRQLAAISRQRENLQQEREALERDGEDVQQRLRELDARLSAIAQDAQRSEEDRRMLQRKRAELAARERRFLSERARIRQLGAGLKEREEGLTSQDANLQKKSAAIAARERDNRRMREELELQRTRLAEEKDELRRWETTLVSGADSPPPRAITQARAPVVVVTSPEATRRTTTRGQVTIEGVAFSNRQVTGLEFLVNDQKLGAARAVPIGMEETKEAAYRQFSRSLSLREGSNRIVVRATDDAGLSSDREVLVVYQKPRGQVHIVAVGIDTYLDSKVPPLRYAVSDAERLVAAVRNTLNVSAGSNVEILTNEKATARNIRLALGTRLLLREGKEDTVIVYFSGHGGIAANSAFQDGTEKYLLSVDADPSDYPATALAMESVGRLIDRLESERVIFLADTCYSGAAGGRTVKPRGRDFRALPSEGVEKRLEGAGRVIMTASAASEVAQEMEDLGHGVFTYFLIKGLEGREADGDGDGTITITELYQYVSQQVQEKTGRTQHPQISNRLGGEIALPVR